jgi:hypothetical protein
VAPVNTIPFNSMAAPSPIPSRQNNEESRITSGWHANYHSVMLTSTDSDDLLQENQIMTEGGGTKDSNPIRPFLMFSGERHGQAEAAINFYTSIFPNSRIISIEKYGPKQVEPEGTVRCARFVLNGQELMAIDSAGPAPIQFHAFPLPLCELAGSV